MSPTAKRLTSSARLQYATTHQPVPQLVTINEVEKIISSAGGMMSTTFSTLVNGAHRRIESDERHRDPI